MLHVHGNISADPSRMLGECAGETLYDRQRQRQRQRKRQTDRDRETDRQKQIETDRYRQR